MRNPVQAMLQAALRAPLAAVLRRAHLVAALALVAALWASLAGEVLARPPVAIDEPHWITSGALTLDLVTGLAGPSRWEMAYDERGLGSWGNHNPPLGKLVIGVLVAAGQRGSELIDYRWNFSLDYAGNRDAGNLPPQRTLVPVRLGITVLGAVALFLVYLCAVQVTGARWLALVAPAVLFLSPVFRFHAARAYTDVPQLCCLLASIVAFNAFLRRGDRRAFYAALVLAGMAAAVKFSAGTLVLAQGALVLARGAPWRRRLRDAALVAALPFAVFCAVNPYLYPNPVGRTLDIVSTWSDTMAELQRDPRLVAKAVASPGEGLALVAEHGILEPWLSHSLLDATELGLPLAIAVLAAGLAAALVRHRIRFVASPRDPRLAAALTACAIVAALRLFAGLSLSAAVFLLGLQRLAMGPVGGPDGADAGARRFVIAAFAVTLLLTGFWLPFDWHRYYLRILALVPVFHVAGMALLTEIVVLERRDAADPAAAETAG